MTSHTVVVGGTRGVGREVVRVLSERGHLVSAIGRRIPAPEDATRSNVTYHVTDVTDDESTSRMLDSLVQEKGMLDSLVVLQRYKGPENIWHGELETSLTATNKLIEKASMLFRPDGGSIVVLSSIADSFVSASQPVGYHVAKAGILHMARYYAVALGSKGIRVNCVAPCTFIKEENQKFFEENTALQSLFKRVVPLGRMGRSEDTAKVVAFLCSGDSGFVTGQHITVDGGVSLVSQEALARQLAGI